MNYARGLKITMLQNLHGDSVRLSMKAAIKQNPLQGPVQRHAHMIPAPESQGASRSVTLGGKKVRAGKESKVRIQHMTLGSDQVDEETKESRTSHYKCIDLPTTGSSYFTRAADLANPVPGVSSAIKGTLASSPAGTKGLENLSGQLGENTLSLSVSVLY